MGFHWSLQKVLDVAEKRELAIKAELFRLARNIALGQEAIQHRRAMLRLLLADLAAAPLSERLAGRDVLMRCRQAEEQAVGRLQQQVDDWQEQREARTADLAKLTAKKDALQRMRSEARKAYQRHLDLREQQRADEVFQMAFARHGQKTFQRRSA
jgi:flagellar biosynthesis chaperone FliJ